MDIIMRLKHITCWAIAFSLTFFVYCIYQEENKKRREKNEKAKTRL